MSVSQRWFCLSFTANLTSKFKPIFCCRWKFKLMEDGCKWVRSSKTLSKENFPANCFAHILVKYVECQWAETALHLRPKISIYYQDCKHRISLYCSLQMYVLQFIRLFFKPSWADVGTIAPTMVEVLLTDSNNSSESIISWYRLNTVS